MPLVINGQRIDDALIEQEFGAIKAHYESLSSISCCERDDEFRGYANDNITFRALLTQEAQRMIPDPTASEVDRAFEQLKQEHGGDEQFYANSGLSPEQDELIRRDLSVNLKVEIFRNNACDTIPAPTEGECREYYDSNLGQFSDADEVRASHIFKSVREVEKREIIFQSLCEARQQLIDGADFTELAKRHSDKPEEEIDLGYFKRGELMDEFEVVAFSMKQGEVSPVFCTQHGFHLAKVTERKTGSPKPFEVIREEIEQELTAKRQDAKLQELVDVLKKVAEIEYTGPDETLDDHNHD